MSHRKERCVESECSQLRKVSLWIFFVLSVSFALTQVAQAARLKDIADVEGVRGNQLYGYGLVVGLNGTGDGNQVDFTNKSISNMLERSGLSVSSEEVRVKNVASVMVTATLPSFIRPGSRIDVTVSSLGDAKSLQGGTLIMTPLSGADGNTYAVAQGAVIVGGFSAGTEGDEAIKNHPTVGAISNGASVERAIPFDLFQSQMVRIVLRNPDFTTMKRVVREINTNLGRPLAAAIDSASVEIPLVGNFADDPISFVSRIEQLNIPQDTMARVVVNEKTGTIVIGESVTVNRVALAHGNLNIVIRSETQVSQPQPFAEVGETAVVNQQDVQVGEDVTGLSIVGGAVTLGELVDALNSLGATPRDLISIFSALQEAGALQAELVIM